MRKIFYLPIFVCLLAACSGGGEDQNSSVAADSNSTAKAEALTFSASSFSSFIFYSEDFKTVRLAFSFFPDGTRFDFKGRKILIPCGFKDPAVADGVDVNLNAPVVAADCHDGVELSLVSTSMQMGLEGVEGSMEDVNQMLEDHFNLLLTTTHGMESSQAHVALAPGAGKLTDFLKALSQQNQ